LRACCPRDERTGGRDRDGTELLRELVSVLQWIVAGMLLLTVVDLEGRIVVEERRRERGKGTKRYPSNQIESKSPVSRHVYAELAVFIS